LPAKRYLKRHQRLPVGAISRYKPRPSNKRTAFFLTIDLRRRTQADRPRRPRMIGWWARSDSTTHGKPLTRLQYQEFAPRRCP
jgi:hypothetical protein